MTPRLLAQDRPLCFLHIAKTGGTSLTDAISRLYGPDRTLSDGGNLSVPFLEGLGERLSGRVFLAGHPAPGVASFLEGRADLITVLRSPEEQAVSNYLHVLSDPANELHPVALQGSFTDFLRRRPDQIDYQTRSLCIAFFEDGADRERVRLERFDHLLARMDSLAFVGVMERAEACASVIAALSGLHEPLPIAHLNSAVYRGVSARTIEALRRDYRALAGEPALAAVFAREARAHAHAGEILRRLESAALSRPPRAAPAGDPGRLEARWFTTVRGRRSGPAIEVDLAGASGHLVHGPYHRLPAGAYEVTFHLALRRPRGAGRIEVEVLANGRLTLRRRWLGETWLRRSVPPKLAFVNLDPSAVLEYRIGSRGFAGGGRLVFEGVAVRPASPWRAWPSIPVRALSALRRMVRPAAGLGGSGPPEGS